MIRLIRVMEYEFPDNQTAQDHMKHMGVPMTGTTHFGDIIIRSAAVLDLSVFDPEPTDRKIKDAS